MPAAIARGARLLRGALLATCDSVAVQVSLETNQSVPMSRDLHDKAKKFLVTADGQVNALPR